jgi:hypothetical protein
MINPTWIFAQPVQEPLPSSRIVQSVLHGNRLVAKLTTVPGVLVFHNQQGQEISTAVGQSDNSKFDFDSTPQ